MRVEVMNNLSPYQLELIRTVLSLGHGDRLLLTGPPGVGKTTAITAAVSEFIRGRAAEVHVLVVAPRPLAQYLTPILREVVEENVMFISAPEYRRLQTVTSAGENPWAAVPVAVTSLDFTKADERLKHLLEVPWDAVFIEEGETSDVESFRTRLIRTLWESPRIGIAVATSDIDSPLWVDNISSLKIVRWTTGSLGLSHSRHRNIEPVEYDLTDAEREFAKQFLETLSSVDRNDSRSDFVASMLHARIASSLLSAEQILRRYENTLSGQSVDASEIINDHQGIEIQDGPRSLLTSEDCFRLLELFERVEVDSKWQACRDLLRALVDERLDRAVVIFTSFVSTSHYVESLAGEFGVHLYAIRGSQEADVITKTLELAETRPGLLIATDVPLRGLDLSFADRVIHYDLPRKPKILTSRFSRFISRQGTGPVSHYFLLDGLTATKEDLTILIERVLEVERSWE